MLELDGVTFAYGGNKVIDGLSATVARGDLLGVIGPNGAGKSTLFHLIGGAVAPASGSIRLEGRRLNGLRSWDRSRSGIGRTYQVPHPFRAMSVYENVLVAATHAGGISIPAARVRVSDVLAMTGLIRVAGRLAGELSLLDLKRLELAKALAQQPKLLLLDEIAGGLTDAECEVLLEIVRSVWKDGVTVIWIEHVLHALKSVATRMAVLYSGKFIIDGDPAHVLASDKVREIYLGT